MCRFVCGRNRKEEVEREMGERDNCESPAKLEVEFSSIQVLKPRNPSQGTPRHGMYTWYTPLFHPPCYPPQLT